MSYWEQVKNYHSEDREYIYFGFNGENTEDFKGIGVEDEFDRVIAENQELFREQVAEILLTSDFKNHYFVEKDASLSNGMEMITQPHTVEEMRSFIKYVMPSLLARLNDVGVENFSENSAMHIHISKKVFGNTQEEQIESIAKLWRFVSNYRSEFLKLGNRKHCLKCLFPPKPLTKTKAIEKVTRCFTTENRKLIYRYNAVNVKPKNTVEIRCMQGTTDIGVLTALVEMWWHLANKSTTISWEDSKTWDKWFEDAPQVVKDYIQSKEIV